MSPSSTPPPISRALLEKLEVLGRRRLSKNFFMREFLYSEISHAYSILNVPDHPEIAVKYGSRLCEELLEPLQERFGRLFIRSGYRSPAVNAFGNMNKMGCASNETNFGRHIWDHADSTGHFGASACVVVPAFAELYAAGTPWQAMAWWIHDNLPYNYLCFFPKLAAFNIGWHEMPEREIRSFIPGPDRLLTKPGEINFGGDHSEHYAKLLQLIGPVII